MVIFLQWILPCIILVIAVILVLILPSSQVYQIIPPLFSGIIIFILNKFINFPDVVIDNIGKGVRVLSNYREHWFSIDGTLINKSSTGVSSLNSITLRIFLSDNINDYIDALPIRGEPDIIGYRFETHGIFPDHILTFFIDMEITDLYYFLNKKAEVRLDVVGQKIKIYKTHISKADNYIE